MNTKIFVVRKKWLIAVLLVVLLLFGYVSYLRSIKNPMWIIGRCEGRQVSVQIIHTNMTIFSITINSKPVYMEIDVNKDSRADFIVHLENGVEKYTTHIDKTGKVNVREVVYYSAKGDKYTLYDAGETCMFTQRVWESRDGKMRTKETLVEGHWTPITKREQQDSKLETPVWSTNSPVAK